MQHQQRTQKKLHCAAGKELKSSQHAEAPDKKPRREATHFEVGGATRGSEAAAMACRASLERAMRGSSAAAAREGRGATTNLCCSKYLALGRTLGSFNNSNSAKSPLASMTHTSFRKLCTTGCNVDMVLEQDSLNFMGSAAEPKKAGATDCGW